jgi:hypothetical protein
VVPCPPGACGDCTGGAVVVLAAGNGGCSLEAIAGPNNGTGVGTFTGGTVVVLAAGDGSCSTRATAGPNNGFGRGVN